MVIVTYISWFSGLYLKDYFMYKAVTLAGGISEPLLTCSSLYKYEKKSIAELGYNGCLKINVDPKKIDVDPCI